MFFFPSVLAGILFKDMVRELTGTQQRNFLASQPLSAIGHGPNLPK